MSDQVLNAFDVVPDYDLSIMKAKQTLFDVTINILENESCPKEVKPDVVLVHGDTSYNLRYSIGLFYLQIPVGHVAGLRTYNIYSHIQRSSIDKLLALYQILTLHQLKCQKRIFLRKVRILKLFM